MCEIACNPGLKFSEDVPEFYTCGAEGFWRPTLDPSKPLVYPSCSRKFFMQCFPLSVWPKIIHCIIFLQILASKPAQRVFRIQMHFPSDVLCNEAGQTVLRQRVSLAVNSLNRDWNFCSYSTEGSRECKELQINVKCNHYRGGNSANRVKRQIIEMKKLQDESGTYVLDASVPVEK